MIHDKHALTRLERVYSLFTTVRPGEGVSILLFSLYGFLLLTSYHVLKTIREPLLLSEFDAETRSYAVALIAILLLFLVPLYGVLFRHTRTLVLIRWLTVFFAVNIGVFYVMGRSGQEIGFTYFVFIGIVGVMMIAQFWAFAADCFNVKTGQRVFPVIMIGAAAGGVAGAQLTKYLTGTGTLPTLDMMPIAALLLIATALIGAAARRSVPRPSRCPHAGESIAPDDEDGLRRSLGGFALVMRDRYLLLLAAMVVLLNWINTTGETVLAWFVDQFARAEAGGDPARVGEIISAFYGDYFFWVNLLGFLAQTFLVARVYRWIGMRGALLVMPLIAVVGYGLMVFVPIFSIIRIVKIMENSVDYSLMNTTRQALFLPTSREVKYEGKIAIETFFWRFGDLIQAVVIFVGIHGFGMAIPQFALVNFALALVWLALAVMVGRHYCALARDNPFNRPPELREPLPDLWNPPGTTVAHTLARDAFVDADPGDVLSLRAQLGDGRPLPEWLSFSPTRRRFAGTVPTNIGAVTEIEVVARDFDGLSASGRFVLRHRSLVEEATDPPPPIPPDERGN